MIQKNQWLVVAILFATSVESIATGAVRQALSKAWRAVRAAPQARRDFLRRTEDWRLDNSLSLMGYSALCMGTSVGFIVAEGNRHDSFYSCMGEMSGFAGISLYCASMGIMAPFGTAAAVSSAGLLAGIATYHDHKRHQEQQEARASRFISTQNTAAARVSGDVERSKKCTPDMVVSRIRAKLNLPS